MEQYEAIDWAIDAMQSKLDELGGGWEYEQTLEAIRVLNEMKQELK